MGHEGGEGEGVPAWLALSRNGGRIWQFERVHCSMCFVIPVVRSLII